MNAPRSGDAGLDLVIIAVVALQGLIVGITPSVANVINSGLMLMFAVVTGYTAMKQAGLRKVADETKAVVDITKRTTDAVHVLTNSQMGAQLRLNVQFARASAVQLHRIAELTQQTEGDVAAALAADIVVKEQEALLQAHLIRQAIVDAGEKKEDFNSQRRTN